jgi:AraC-like DNA-binding protein
MEVVGLGNQPTLQGALIQAPHTQLFISHDLEQTRFAVGSVMTRHLLGIDGRAQRLNARMHHVSLGDVSISRLKYGADVSIQPGCLEAFYLVQMPLAGHAVIECGKQRVDSCPTLASVLNPTEPTVMHWSADNDQLMVRIDRSLIDRAIWAHLGQEPEEALRFQLGFRWQDCAAWRYLVQYLAECIAHDFDPAKNKLVASNMEQLVVSTLLSSHVHNFSDAKPTHRATVLPRHVRKVEEYLRTHAHEPVCADQLAELAGVSLRSLYAGFKEYCGVTPMQYLKNLRLEGARNMLLNEPDSVTVATVAMQWGFSHLGRFSVEFKQRFGESPSEMLRKH